MTDEKRRDPPRTDRLDRTLAYLRPRPGTYPELKLVAVAAAGPEETTGAFDHAPGLTVDTRRYDDARKMLDTERLDVVQVSGRNDRIPAWSLVCLERGLPVMAEKPLAMDLPALEGLFHAAQKTKSPWCRCTRCAACRRWRRSNRRCAAGAIGDPLVSFSQKTYRWGTDRVPTSIAAANTFPGLAPWIGIHAFDWLHWILGDVFTEVQGREGTTARPDFTACASQAAFVLTMKNGGVASRHARLSPAGRRPHACGRTPAHRRNPRSHRDCARSSTK